MFRDRTEDFHAAAYALASSASPSSPSSSWMLSNPSYNYRYNYDNGNQKLLLPDRRPSHSSASSLPHRITTVTAPHATTTPEWIREYPQITAELDDAEDRLHELRSLYIAAQQQITVPSSDIEHHAAAVLHSIKTAQQYITAVSEETNALQTSRSTLRSVAHNMTQSIGMRCERMYRELQRGLENYRKEREQLEQRLLHLKGRDTAAEHRQWEQDEKEAHLQRQGLSDDQVMAVMEHEERIRTRNEEMEEVVKEMEEVQGLFKDLGSMVKMQDEMVDRIDVNVDRTHRDVHQGEEEVAAAERHQQAGQRSRRVCMIVFLLVITALVFIGFIAI